MLIGRCGFVHLERRLHIAQNAGYVGCELLVLQQSDGLRRYAVLHFLAGQQLLQRHLVSNQFKTQEGVEGDTFPSDGAARMPIS